MTGSPTHPINDLCPRFLACALPLDSTSWAFVSAAAISYSILGLALSIQRCRLVFEVRLLLAWGLLNLAVAALLFVGPMLSAIWSLAAWYDRIPPGPWGVYEGNHGPWRWVYNLDRLLGFTFGLPFYAFLAALLSGSLKPQPPFAVVALSCPVIFVLLLWSHYWLVD